MKRFLLSILILSFAASALSAQDAAEKFNQFKQQSKQDYDTTQRRQKKAYLEFRDKVNKDFADQMLKDWESVGARKPEPRRSAPQVVPEVKPREVPAEEPAVVKPAEEPKEEPKEEPAVVKPSEEPKADPLLERLTGPKEDARQEIAQVLSRPKPAPPVAPIIPFLEIYVEDTPFEVVEENSGKWDDDLKIAPLPVPAPGFQFYGTTCRVRYPEQNKFKIKSIENKSLSNLWLQLSKKSFDVVIFDCLKVKESLDLCDWAYIQFINTFAGTIYQAGSNEAAYLSFYLLTQSGYKLRLSKDLEGRLHVLVGVDGTITGCPYWIFDGVNFVLIDNFKVDNMFVCNVEYHGETPAKLAITNRNSFTVKQTDVRTFKSAYDNLSATGSANANLINFYNDYPNFYMDNDPYSTWKYYALTPLTENTKAELYPALREAVKGKSQAEAVTMLLHFVQTSLDYKVDEEVWGAERVFFGEETLYYPYCDCEDRAILYSILVRDILGLEVALIYYPGHLAAATAVEGGTGDYYELDGKRFFVTDPTFINAGIGDTMTCVRGLGAALLKL